MLDERSATQITSMVDGLGDGERRRLAGAMATIRDVLDGTQRPRSYLLRAPRPGDLGWVISRNATLYESEYGWNDEYEPLVARIVADYGSTRDPRREAAWMAEIGRAHV